MEEKYAVMNVDDGNEEIIALCDTKEEALTLGGFIAKSGRMAKGVLSCIRSTFDAKGKRIPGNMIICYVW